MNNPTPDQRIQKHHQFFNANWRSIASFAYSNFLSKGRGIIAVPEKDFVFADKPELAPVHFKYFPESEGKELMNDYEGSKEQGWLKDYDPEVQVVLTVIRFDSEVSSYLIGSQPSPPECYAEAKAKDN